MNIFFASLAKASFGGNDVWRQGGASYSKSKGFFELGSLYKFRLRDPFYKKCSATGAGLTAAIAGVETEFLLQCLDR